MKKIIATLTTLALTAVFVVGCAPVEPEPTQIAQNPAIAATDQPSNPETGITPTVKVQGTAEIDVPPTLAHMDFYIRTTGVTAADASNENTRIVDLVTEALKMQGIAEEDIVTGYYNVYPQENYDVSPPEIVGYEVSTSLSVTTTDVDNAGKYIDAGVNAGATVNNIYFSLDDDSDAYAQAMTAASEDALKKAEVLATAQGKTLGDVISVVEGYSDASPIVYANSMPMDEAAEESAAGGTSISPSDTTVHAMVTIYYGLN